MRNQGARIPEEAYDEFVAMLESYDRLAVTATGDHTGADKEIAALKARLSSGDPIWWTDIAQAQLCMIDVLTDDEVKAQLRSWRRRFQEVAGDSRYALYIAGAPPLTGTDGAALRADLASCIQSVYYFYASYGVSARSRSDVTALMLRVALGILIVQGVMAWLLSFVTGKGWLPISVGVLTALEFMLATSAVAVVGSVISVQRRLQDPTVDVDPFYRYVQMRGDWLSTAFISPLFGAIFGIVLYGLLVSKLVGTSVINVGDKNGIPTGATNIAALLVLGFLAGFAEQLVPDALTRLASRVFGGTTTVNTVSTSSGGSAGGAGDGSDKNGAKAAPPGAAAPTPTVTAINPATGPAAGGTPVTLTGTGLTGLAGATFGGTAATAVSASSDTQATATSPAGTAGSIVDVVVTGPNGDSAPSAAGKFTYT